MDNDLYDIKELVAVLEPYIKRLEVNQLLPPVMLIVRSLPFETQFNTVRIK